MKTGTRYHSLRGVENKKPNWKIVKAHKQDNAPTWFCVYVIDLYLICEWYNLSK
ncbi:hypothetical protein RYX36_002619 [Vicia faba]